MEKALRWVFADRTTGAIVVAQWPNLSLWIFIAAWIAATVCPAGAPLGLALRVVAGSSLVLWALDEMVRGVNPWRRCLGAGLVAYEVFHVL